jgi:hypothetical protein
MPIAPDSPRQPPPRRPSSEATILADHEKEKRRQQRPVSDKGVTRTVSGLTIFVGTLTWAGGPVWSSLHGATSDAGQICPYSPGWYSCDVTFEVEGGTPGARIEVGAIGSPYHTGQTGGGLDVLILDGSGDGSTSVHYQGLLTLSDGLLVSASTDFTAAVVGTLQGVL